MFTLDILKCFTQYILKFFTQYILNYYNIIAFTYMHTQTRMYAHSGGGPTMESAHAFALAIPFASPLLLLPPPPPSAAEHMDCFSAHTGPSFAVILATPLAP